MAPVGPPSLKGWGLRVPGGVARLVETFTLIGLGENNRFFFRLFDRAHSRRVFPLETEIFYTIVESVLVRSTGDG